VALSFIIFGLATPSGADVPDPYLRDLLHRETASQNQTLDDFVGSMMKTYDLSAQWEPALAALDEDFVSFLKSKGIDWYEPTPAQKEHMRRDMIEYWRSTHKLPDETTAWFGLMTSGLNVSWQASTPDYRVLSKKRPDDFAPKLLMLFRSLASRADCEEWFATLKQAYASATNEEQRATCFMVAAYRTLITATNEFATGTLDKLPEWLAGLYRSESSPLVLKKIRSLQLAVAIIRGTLSEAAEYAKDSPFRAWRPMWLLLDKNTDRAREAVEEIKALTDLSADERRIIRAAEEALAILPPQITRYEVNWIPLDRARADVILESLVLSPDYKRMAFVAGHDQQSVVLDGVEGNKYQKVLFGNLLFSPDSKHLAYPVVHSGGGLAFVLDGREGKQYENISEGTCLFSPDSKRFAYGATRNGKRLVVLDGAESKEYEGLIYRPVFSLDGGHLGFGAQQAAKQLVVIDGKEGKTYDSVNGLEFSPDGKQVMYAAERAGKWSVVVSGVSGKAYDGVGRMVFSPDGNRVAFIAARGGKYLTVLNGKEEKEYDGISAESLIFSPDSHRFAYLSENHGRQFAVVDGTEGERYDGVFQLLFSSDSEQIAYSAKRGMKYFCVVNGKSGKEYDSFGENSICFSPNGKRLAYSARRGEKWVKIVDDLEGPMYDATDVGFIFSPDSKRTAYSARRERKQFVVVDGVEGKEYDGIGEGSLAFSPDSRHVVYEARFSSKGQLILDGMEGPDYYARLDGTKPVFDDSSALHYLVSRGAELFRLELKLK
jgi:WD40 repeat protein